MDEILNKLREAAELQQQASPRPWAATWAGDYCPILADVAGAEVCYTSNSLLAEEDGKFLLAAGNLDLADVVRAVECLQQSEQQAAAENLRLKELLATLRAMATRSVPQCLNLEAIDRVLRTQKEVARA